MNLKQKYEKEVKDELKKTLKLENSMSVPTLRKITLNIGLGEAIGNPKIVDKVRADLALIAGQMPVATKSKKDVSNFKVRKGMVIGMMVTLRGDKMWDFAEKLISVTLPRIRDFRGLEHNSFDGKGNYSIGIREYNTFVEIDPNTIDRIRGLQVTLETTARNNDEGKKLLELLGFPFKK